MSTLRKLGNVIVVVLVLNFLGMAVAVALLAQRAHVDEAKLAQMWEVLFPPPEVEPGPEDRAPEAPPQPPSAMEQLVALLDAQSGKPVERRVADVRRSFDQRTALLSRAEREIEDRQRALEAGARQLLADRAQHEQARAAWDAQVQAAAARASDVGFARALALYEQMPPKQAKTMLLGLDEEAALAYLRAMDTRPAGKILKELKTPPETDKARALIERLREGDAATAAAEAGNAGAAPAGA